jgi:hypothetical protein
MGHGFQLGTACEGHFGNRASIKGLKIKNQDFDGDRMTAKLISYCLMPIAFKKGA